MNRKKTDSRLPQGVRKHIRQEKASIRRQVSDSEERGRLIAELYGQFRSGRSN